MNDDQGKETEEQLDRLEQNQRERAMLQRSREEGESQRRGWSAVKHRVRGTKISIKKKAIRFAI